MSLWNVGICLTPEFGYLKHSANTAHKQRRISSQHCTKLCNLDLDCSWDEAADTLNTLHTSEVLFKASCILLIALNVGSQRLPQQKAMQSTVAMWKHFLSRSSPRTTLQPAVQHQQGDPICNISAKNHANSRITSERLCVRTCKSTIS